MIMAEFLNLGRSVANVANICVINNNKEDIAKFLVDQQRIIQEQVITERHEKNAVGNKPASASGGNNNSNTSKKSSALARMKALSSQK